MDFPEFNKWWLVPPAILASIFGIKRVFTPPKPGATTPGTPAPGGTGVIPPVPFTGTKLTAHLSDAFFVGLLDLATYFNSKGSHTTASDFLAIFNAESSVLTPSLPGKPTGSHVANSIGCAGLNQICATLAKDPLSGLKAVGFTGTTAQYTALAPEDQLKYVRAFFDTKSVYAKIHNVADLYLVNFAPAFIGASASQVMFRAGDPRYDKNAGIDTAHKGFITVGDMGPFVARTAQGPAWNEALGRISKLQGVV
jgi:hypothetical protein